MAKCADCGYLTVRIKSSYSFGEAPSDFRERGVVPVIYDEQGRNQHPFHEQEPICFILKKDLKKEFKTETTKGNNTVSAFNVLHKYRDCDTTDTTLGFTEYRQGFTPKEHREMLDRQWMLDFKEKREQEDREWRSKEEKERREWQQKQSAKRFRWEVLVVGGVIASLFVISQILAAFIERGSLW